MAAEQLLNGRYRLLRPLGAGGMASVYLAEDLRLGRRVAVKILHPQFAADPAFVARFDAEARMVAGLSHPAIVQVYDVGHDGDRYYIVMEYVEGDTLKDAVTRQGSFPVTRALRVVSSVLAALDFAHTHGLVHRDIKSQNVLLTPGGDVKVTDFGIARAVGGAGAPTLTATNMVIGTVQYFSPEQAQGRPATPQSDVYAAGIVLYEMLTGKLPFEADNPLAVAMQQINQAPPLPTRLNRAIPAPVEAIVLKAMAKNPAERYSSAAAMKTAVDGLLAGSAEGTRVTPRVAAPPPPPTTTRAATGARATARAAPTVNVGTGAATATPARPSSRNLWIGVFALALILFTLLGVLFRNGGFNGFGGAGTATETPTVVATTTDTPTAQATPPAPTATARVVAPPVARATATPVAPTGTPTAATTTDTPTAATTTDTPTTSAPTATVVPPTDTAQPTETATMIPTDTPAPSETPTPQPSPTDTVATTDTPQPTQTATSPGPAAITLSPSSIKPGGTFTVKGSGWPAGDTVTITGDFLDGTKGLGMATVRDDGSFSTATLTLNPTTTLGSYQVTATDDNDSSNTATSNLSVNSP